MHGPQENKTYQFPEGPFIECFVIYFDFPIRQSYGKNMAKFGARAITVQLYPGRDTFKLDQGHVTKKQPITVLKWIKGKVSKETLVLRRWESIAGNLVLTTLTKG